MSTTDYPPPLDKLVTYGDCRELRDWPNYLELGFQAEHVPDLIRMAADERWNECPSDSLEVWAPVHAIRVLGQLKAEEAIEPLIRLFHQYEVDDWIPIELPTVLSMIGPSAIPALKTYLADESRDEYQRSTA